MLHPADCGRRGAIEFTLCYQDYDCYPFISMDLSRFRL